MRIAQSCRQVFEERFDATRMAHEYVKFIGGYFIKVPDYERQTSQRVRLSARS